jgi:formylglycine-generating enzyme required for sulfatase activity
MGKYALVVGVGEYRADSDFEPLPGARADAEAVARVLEDPVIGGFEVKRLFDPDPVALGVAIERLFGRRRNKDDLLLLYFSGHGHKDRDLTGRFYLATPAARKGEDGDYIKATLLESRAVHDALENCPSRRKVVILDCCFSAAFAGGLSTKDSTTVDLRAALGGEGTAVLASSASTRVSLARADGELSLYTQYLVEGITTGAADEDGDGWLSADEVHQYAKRKLGEAAPGMKPEIHALREGYRIVLGRAPIGDPARKYRLEVQACLEDGNIPPAGRAGLEVLRIELSLPEAEARAIEDLELAPFRKYAHNLETYAQACAEELAYCGGTLNAKAHERLARLQAKLGLRDEDAARISPALVVKAPPQEQAQAAPPQGKTRVYVAMGVLLLGGLGIAQLKPAGFNLTPVAQTEEATPPAPVSQEAATEPERNDTAASNAISFRHKQVFRDCADCPEMVYLQGGEFEMGSDKGGDDEKLVHTVKINAFAMGKYEVTKAQFAAFVNATQYKTEAEQGEGCYGWTGSSWAQKKEFNWKNMGFPQDDTHPVACVSWHDAVAYTEWLSQESGQTYRLPTEAEWEYAARAGTDTDRYWGDDADQACRYANVADKTAQEKFSWTGIHDCADAYVYTAPVGQFIENKFGLKDMLGNVWEWTCSVYAPYKDGKENACLSKKDASQRVVRGGSWDSDPARVRSATRDDWEPSGRDFNLGFRLSRIF